jgi:hypothetical protein
MIVWDILPNPPEFIFCAIFLKVSILRITMNLKKIIIVLCVTLLIILLIVGTTSKYGSDEQWPPIVSDCPDYWELKGTKDAPICVNTRKLGTCSSTNGSTMDFSKYPFNDEVTGTCSKYKWANACGVSWDGLTYGVENPCNKDTSI